MSQKKIFFKNNWGLPCQARQAKKKSSPWKIIEVTHSRRSGRGFGTGVLIFWFFFFFKIPDLAQRPTSAPIVAKIAARWRYRLPSNNLTAHYDSQFFTSFHLIRKPKNASKRLWIGPKHNSVHFKSLCGCLLIDRWSCVHPVYAGNRL